MKILLIQPPLNPNILGTGRDYLTEPVALQLLSANLKNHDVFLADLRIKDDLKTRMENLKPDLVGITCCAMTETLMVKQIAKYIKKINPDIYVIIGGQHPTFASQDFVDNNIDFIVFGEGELTFQSLVDALEKNKENIDSIQGIGIISNGHIYITNPRPLIKNIDLLQFPDRELIFEFKSNYYYGNGKNVSMILASRGCPYKCSFCSIWKFHNGTYRERSANNIFNELVCLDEEFIHFADDTFLYNIPRSLQLIELIKTLDAKKKYKFWIRPDIVVKNSDLILAWVDIGLTTACVSLESFKNEDLNKMNKGITKEINDAAIDILKKHKLEIIPYFIISPDYSHNDFDNLIGYINRWELQNPVFSILTPLPGTELYEQIKNEIIFKEINLFDLAHPVVNTCLPYNVFMERFLELYERFYCINICKEKSVRMPHFVEYQGVKKLQNKTKNIESLSIGWGA